jgi:hypothetical protein
MALATALATLATASAAPGAAFASGWSIQSTPNPATSGAIASVSCQPNTNCAAVGSYVNSSNRPEMLAEQWSGGAWTILPTPNPSGIVDSSLTGVSCTSTSACMAVGNGLNTSDSDSTLAGQWNGNAWSIQTIAAPAYSGLSGVSCTASNACIAVGASGISSTSSLTLAEAWNGAGWTTQSTPNPVGAAISSLSGVSCTPDSACTAVGYYVNTAGADAALAEQWTPAGGRWTIELPADPTGATGTVLTGVACTSASACTAVGHSVDSSGVQQALAEHWNGSTWTITLSSSSPTSSGLSGVSCTADTACAAVGQGNGAPLAEQWNGGTWATTLNPSGTASGALAGVSCSGASACMAGGQAASAPLAEQWNGAAWVAQTTPNPPGTGILSSVSCTTGSAVCAAVGYSSPTAALAEQWTGTAWTFEPSVSTGASVHPVLSGVSCAVANACTAVGSISHIYCSPPGCPHGMKLVTGTLGLQWNGSGWLTVPTPNPSQATPSELSAVSCPSANACTAVGGTLVEVWNGTAWTIESGPAAGALSGVSCPSTSACTAVGSAGAATYAAAWNGSGWTTEITPNPTGAASSVLTGVSCASSSSCAAVGYYVTASGADLPLAEQWAATGGWKIHLPATVTGATSSVLTGVSCTSASACTAVGHYVTGSGAQNALAERWNGSGWAIQTTPNPQGGTASNLSGVSCTTTTSCVAVGDYINASGTDVTLAESYSG